MLSYKDYCDEKTSDELEKLGYPRYHYDATEVDKIFRIISLYDAQKWLREVKKVIIVIVPYTYNIITETSTWTYEIWLEDNLEREVHDFKTYEEALSEGVCKAIEILKILKEG